MNEQIAFDLSGTRCVVTGASGALGTGIVRKLVAAGAKVALLDIDGVSAETVAGSCDPDRTRTECFKVDVTVESDVVAALGRVAALWGGLDLLVNAAGVLKHRPIDEMTIEDFQRIIDVNLTGTFLTCREAVRIMKKQKRGKIVNIASLGGETGRPGVGVNYAASKAGVAGLTRSLAREAGVHGIYVNAINPGPILTDLTRQVPQEVFEKWNAGRAVEKDGLPEDVADAVLFLASGRSDWITGISLDINGGIYM